MTSIHHHHVRLQPDPSSSPSPPSPRRLVKTAAKAIMKSRRISFPKHHHLPIRLRPWFLLFTVLIMLLLAFFGFSNLAHSLPFNAKLLHLTCFCIATGVFYFILDVDEDARRIWFWRHANLIFTAVVCFFFGGFVSEVVQSLLPHKHFDLGDVVANVIGSTVGLYASYHIEKHYRSRREIARLYRPLDTDDHEDLEDHSDDDVGPSRMQLLPLFNPKPADSSAKSSLSSKAKIHHNLSDVWDDREEIFGVGDDSESEDAPTPTQTNRFPNTGLVPTITITRP